MISSNGFSSKLFKFKLKKISELYHNNGKVDRNPKQGVVGETDNLSKSEVTKALTNTNIKH